MSDFLVFQLYGALSSWGDIAVGEHRRSYGHPSKSAITGLLAAALGIDREDDSSHVELCQQYGVSVCVRARGELLRDYHTTQVPKGNRKYATRQDELIMDKDKLGTILSQRDYHMDAFCQIAVWCMTDDAPYTLEELKQKLKHPHFNLYLGRKSCPVSLPLHPVILSKSLKRAFDDYPLEKLNELSMDSSDKSWFEENLPGNAPGQKELIRYFWERGNLKDGDIGMKCTMKYPRRDQVRSRKRWQFSDREECNYDQVEQR